MILEHCHLQQSSSALLYGIYLYHSHNLSYISKILSLTGSLVLMDYLFWCAPGCFLRASNPSLEDADLARATAAHLVLTLLSCVLCWWEGAYVRLLIRHWPNERMEAVLAEEVLFCWHFIPFEKAQLPSLFNVFVSGGKDIKYHSHLLYGFYPQV